jgi:cobalamin biosynthesis protein CobT
MKVQLSLALALVAALAVVMPRRGSDTVMAANLPVINLNVDNAAPRKVEDTTQKAVARDYASAWQAMSEALDQNRTDLLGANFIGTASDRLTATVEEQRKEGLHQRFTDKGHNADAIFYSPEGSAIELHDTAQLQIDLMDGSKVIHSEDAIVHYVVLLTAAENSWKVRALEAVPSF